jgi:hypothetical protein
MREDDVETRLACPDDAAAIAALIRAQYGAGYADRAFTAPDELAARLADGRVSYAIALEGGRVVGQMAVERVTRHLWEIGRALVRTEARSRGLLTTLDGLLEARLRADRAARFYLGRSVTHHTLSQRHSLRHGCAPLGLLLGVWPADAVEGAAPGQPAISALITGKALVAARPRRLALEGRTRARALELLSGQRIAISSHALRLGAPLRLERLDAPALGLVHLRLGAVGRPATSIADDVARAEAEGARLLWADVPAEHPRAAAAVAALEGLGLSFGAYLPHAGARAEDVVRLQRYLGAPLDPAAIQVVDAVAPLRDALAADAAGAGSRVAVRA